MLKKQHNIEDYQYLIPILIKRFNYDYNDYDDLHQVSLIAINKAIMKHKEGISTIKNFIVRYIIYEIKNYYRNKNTKKIYIKEDVKDTTVNKDYSFLEYELRKLEDPYKRVLILKYYYNYNQKQIASIIQKSQPSVSRIEKEALYQLKKGIISY